MDAKSQIQDDESASPDADRSNAQRGKADQG
jgi:hypothetical protein